MRILPGNFLHILASTMHMHFEHFLLKPNSLSLPLSRVIMYSLALPFLALYKSCLLARNTRSFLFSVLNLKPTACTRTSTLFVELGLLVTILNLHLTVWLNVHWRHCCLMLGIYHTQLVEMKQLDELVLCRTSLESNWQVQSLQ